MELWLILGILSYLSYAISTSIDKYMMNHKYGVLRTNTFKMFFDGLILLGLGLLFFRLDFSYNLLLWSLILGVLYALAGITYFFVLKLRDVSEVIPFLQSSEILLIFLGSLLLFNEVANVFNYIGVVLILIGVYAVLSETGLRRPRMNKAFYLILLVVIIDLFFWLLVKKLLYNAQPISLAITMYFSTTLVMIIYQALFNRKSLKALTKINHELFKIGIAAFFGATGTFLLFSALTLEDASKVYPLAGSQAVFVFLIASLFLKEKFRWHRLIGTLLVFGGIFLISV